MPVAVGLVLAALPFVVPQRGLIVALDIAALLALGAWRQEKPWRSGAIVALPGAAVALARATDDSLGSFALVASTSPVVVAVSGLLVKAGGLLVHRADQEPASGPGDASGGHGRGHRRKLFETKPQRARFLVIVAAVLGIGVSLLEWWGAEEADRRASERAEEIQTALAGRTPESLLIEGVMGSSALPGGPYRFASLGPGAFEASAEVSRALQSRCIRVRVIADGQVSTEIENGRCGG